MKIKWRKCFEWRKWRKRFEAILWGAEEAALLAPNTNTMLIASSDKIARIIFLQATHLVRSQMFGKEKEEDNY